MRVLPYLLAFCVVLVSPLQAGEPAPAEPYVNIEFLWQPAEPGSLAREWAMGFTRDSGVTHQVCWKAGGWPEEAIAVQVTIHDASERLVAEHEHTQPGGRDTRVNCRSAATGIEDASPGVWRYDVYFNDDLVAAERIEVAETLDTAGFFSDPERPYIIGRTNYTEQVAEGYDGTVVFDMTVDETGTVTGVEIVDREGVSDAVARQAEAAGFLYRFPPDPGRESKPLVARQRINFGN